MMKMMEMIGAFLRGGGGGMGASGFGVAAGEWLCVGSGLGSGAAGRLRIGMGAAAR